MEIIQVEENALPILRDSINLKKKLNTIKAENYRTRLKAFEEQYKMKSEDFIREFEAGNLGDEAAWFDWLFVWEAWKRTLENNDIIETLNL